MFERSIDVVVKVIKITTYLCHTIYILESIILTNDLQCFFGLFDILLLLVTLSGTQEHFYSWLDITSKFRFALMYSKRRDSNFNLIYYSQKKGE